MHRLAISFFLILAALSPLNAEEYVVATFKLKPMMSVDGSGQAEGILVTLTREAFERAGHKVSFRHLPFKRAFTEVKLGKVTAMSSLFRTPEREAKIQYPDTPLIEYQMVFIALKDYQRVFENDLSFLQSQRLSLLSGSSYTKRLYDAIDQHQARLEKVKDFDAAARMLLLGRVDVIAVELYSGLEAIRKLQREPDIKILPPPFASIPVYLGYTRERDMTLLMAEVERSFQEMRADGTFNRLLSQYAPQYLIN